ncbi:splicing factor 3a, putative [Bodo saltans]|uniref:Splicing factor 3a, putative n=1 Tax=Bodo saltans TaxID=75058 RepID=A0A0S4JFA9_BODSA|nr:splicing factor 3a, putative [Bodo saltans]|eukprot:CUG88734.1 splicing factor 3a, putative [Bodo saltans]
MRSGVLEKIRVLEADLESCREGVVQQLLMKLSHPRHRILRDHFVLQQSAIAQKLSDKLLDCYLDEDEITQVKEEPTEEGDVLEAIRDFDAKVAELREYHKRYVNARPIEKSLATPDPSLLENVFTVAEQYGSYFDLQSHYQAYQNFCVESRLKGASYVASFPATLELHKFVETLPTLLLAGIPLRQKVSAFDVYKAFVFGLRDYLQAFYERYKPLDQTPLMEDLEIASKGYIEFRDVVVKNNLTQPQHLKRFEKTFAVWDYSSALEVGVTAAQVTEVGVCEAQIVRILSTSLAEIFTATEKKTSRMGSKTIEEIERERKEDDRLFFESIAVAEKHSATAAFVDRVAKAELTSVAQAAQQMQSAAGAQDDEEEAEFLGPDGKPLPKWLVKIMQLKKKFKCDVCGGEVFKGLKMYREHFVLERHAEGLRQLGVGSAHLHHFIGINEMGDVLRFRDILRQRLDLMNIRKRMRDDEENEETQDVNGNVMTKKSFIVFQGRRNNL